MEQYDECEIDSNKNKEESFEVEDSFGVLDNYSGTKSAMERHHEYTKKSLISKEVPLMGVQMLVSKAIFSDQHENNGVYMEDQNFWRI